MVLIYLLFNGVSLTATSKYHHLHLSSRLS